MSEKSIKNKVVSGLFWKFAEAMCADLVSFIVSVILARLLLPADYGEVSLVNVFIVVANVFVVNGLGTALIQKKDADDLDFSSVFYANLALSLVLFAIVWAIAPLVASFYEMPHLAIVLRVLAIKIPVASVTSIQNAYVSRKMVFRKFFFATIIGTVLSAGVGIYMAYKGFGVWALVAQSLCNNVIDTLVLFITIKWYPRLKFSWTRLKGLINYGWKILVSSLIKTGYSQLTNLIIGKLYTSEDLAFYTKGQKYPELIVTDVNSSISSVLFPAIAKYQDDPSMVKAMTRKSMTTSLFIISPLLVGLAALADPIISWMLTDKWIECVPFLRICCIYYVMQPVQTANLQAIRAVGRSDVILKLDIIKRGVGLVILLLLMRHGVIALAFAPVGMTLVATVVNMYANTRIIGYSYGEQLYDVIRNLSPSLLMGAIIYALSVFLQRTMLGDLPIILVCTVLGVGLFLLFSYLMKLDTLSFVFNTAKERLGALKGSKGQ